MHLYGLIGYPLDHSFSKQYFSRKIEQEGLANCAFELFPLKTIDALAGLIRTEQNLKGLAVTIPYKEAVIPYLHELDIMAGQIGAVNCIKISKGRLTGFNTDVIGFEKSLVPLLQHEHQKALVLGSGGSSKAVQHVLNKLGIPFRVVSRKPAANNAHISYEAVTRELIATHSVIINCTPVGMSPNHNDQPAIPYQFLSKKNLLYDLVYTPAQTSFLQKGFENGSIIKNGYEMLVLQAAENWRIWTENF